MPRRNRVQVGTAIGVVALLGAALVLAGMTPSGWLRKGEQTGPAPTEPRPDLLRLNAVQNFASSAQCRECHPQEHASWHDSYHRTMTQVAHPDNVLGNFDGIDVPEGNRIHRLSRRGDELWVQTVPTDGTADDETQAADMPTSAPRRVLVSTGSHHMQVYWAAHGAGNLLDELPIVFIRENRPEQSRWAPLQASYLSPNPAGPDTPIHWNRDCILCHATGGRPELDLQSNMAATKVAELGIACEACHGPAERHVRLERARAARDPAAESSRNEDHAIVNPSKLHPERAAQVCGHCHAASSFISDQLLADFLVSGSSYRPGDDLLQTRVAMLPARLTPEQNEANRRYNPFYEGSYWPDGMIRATGREYNGLVESLCYQKGAMTCLACHSMHHSDPDDQLAPGKESNHACYQCHASYHDNLAAHTHHAADSSGSQCYNCHMPHTTYGLFKAIRSHQITSPNAATALKTGRPAACNMCHLDQTLQWTTDKLHDWYGQPLVELDDDQRSLSVVALNLVQGDTFKRAMFSWIAGWRPALECVRATAATASADPDANGERPGNDAQRATATHWLVPLLAPLLHHEESSVVRLMAWRSLSKIDERYGVDYDFVGSEAQRAESAQRIMELWRQIPAPQRAMGDRLLLLPDGEPDREWTDRLFENRDNRVLRVSE